jgi:uncharacterized protein DUF1217
MVTITSLQSAVLQLYSSANQGGFDYSFLAPSSQGTTFNPGSVKVALANAEKNEAKQLAQVAKDPITQKELARYEKVVKSAKSVDEVLSDPIARKVLMTANGLGAYVDQVGLAKKALMSDPADPNSIAAKLSSTNNAWLAFAKEYDLKNNGIERLYDKVTGFTDKWTVSLQRDGQPVDATLQLTKLPDGSGYQALVNGDLVPAGVDDKGVITINLYYEDSIGDIHNTKLVGKLTDKGMTGQQFDDGKAIATPWTAKTYYSDEIDKVKTNYLGEKRLDMLDKQMPGLGSAVLFKQTAATYDTTLKILGSALGRDVVTTALGLPKQLALQSVEAQMKAIEKRIPDPKKLANAGYADQIAQRYLIMLNGGLGGITA